MLNHDICSIRKSGVGISFCENNMLVETVADYVIREPDFNRLIPLLS